MAGPKWCLHFTARRTGSDSCWTYIIAALHLIHTEELSLWACCSYQYSLRHRSLCYDAPELLIYWNGNLQQTDRRPSLKSNALTWRCKNQSIIQFGSAKTKIDWSLLSGKIFSITTISRDHFVAVVYNFVKFCFAFNNCCGTCHMFNFSAKFHG